MAASEATQVGSRASEVGSTAVGARHAVHHGAGQGCGIARDHWARRGRDHRRRGAVRRVAIRMGVDRDRRDQPESAAEGWPGRTRLRDGRRLRQSGAALPVPGPTGLADVLGLVVPPLPRRVPRHPGRLRSTRAARTAHARRQPARDAARRRHLRRPQRRHLPGPERSRRARHRRRLPHLQLPDPHLHRRRRRHPLDRPRRHGHRAGARRSSSVLARTSRVP